MSCYSPITLKQKDKFNTVPCGRCIGCLQDKRSEWTFRIKEELKDSITSQFVTLTYNDENIKYNSIGKGCLYKPDLQNFFKRLRKREKNNKIRYYAVGEYGSKTFRPHYHIILFNCTNIDNIIKSWDFGHVQIGTVTPQSIHYVTKYVINRFDVLGYDLPPQFATMSRNPGLGFGYLGRTSKFHKKRQKAKVRYNGFELKMPRYYKTKLFSKHEIEIMNAKEIPIQDEREKLAIQKKDEAGKNYFVDEINKKKAKEHLARKYSKCKF